MSKAVSKGVHSLTGYVTEPGDLNTTKCIRK